MEPQLVQIFTDQVIPLLLTMITGLVSLGLLYFNKWLKSKTNSVKTWEAFESVSMIVENTVKEASETIVKEAKAAAEDGTLGKEDALKIKNAVLNQIKGSLPSATTKVLQKSVADLDLYIRGEIEKKIEEAKVTYVME